MRIAEVDYSGGVPVDGYGPGFFRLGDIRHDGGLLVLPQTGIAAWGGVADLAPLLDRAIEFDVVFVGMGDEIAALPAAATQAFAKASLGVEAMATPAACRSYNMLLAEGRRVALAAIPVRTL